MKRAATSALGCPMSFVLTVQSFQDISMNDTPKEKLAIQIGQVDGVHVDDVKLFETRKCQIFE